MTPCKLHQKHKDRLQQLAVLVHDTMRGERTRTDRIAIVYQELERAMCRGWTFGAAAGRERAESR